VTEPPTAPATTADSAQKKVLSARAVTVLSVLCAGTLGVLGGLGAFTFGYGDGAAYLTNNPASCANCHVMQEHYDAWVKSSHHGVATCNDCHLPHDFAGKWITKGDNGFFHSLAFTTGNFHEPIQIKERNRRVTQSACLHCHADYVDHMLPAEPGGQMQLCVHCHGSVGHAGRESGYADRD
jgi:cytochrome c nitrite reductase small subunit